MKRLRDVICWVNWHVIQLHWCHTVMCSIFVLHAPLKQHRRIWQPAFVARIHPGNRCQATVVKSKHHPRSLVKDFYSRPIKPLPNDVRQVRSYIRHSTFNISKHCTHKKVEVLKGAHLKCASSDTTRPTALKTDSNSTFGMSKIGAKRVQNAKFRPDRLPQSRITRLWTSLLEFIIKALIGLSLCTRICAKC